MRCMPCRYQVPGIAYVVRYVQTSTRYHLGVGDEHISDIHRDAIQPRLECYVNASKYNVSNAIAEIQAERCRHTCI